MKLFPIITAGRGNLANRRDNFIFNSHLLTVAVNFLSLTMGVDKVSYLCLKIAKKERLTRILANVY